MQNEQQISSKLLDVPFDSFQTFVSWNLKEKKFKMHIPLLECQNSCVDSIIKFHIISVPTWKRNIFNSPPKLRSKRGKGNWMLKKKGMGKEKKEGNQSYNSEQKLLPKCRNKWKKKITWIKFKPWQSWKCILHINYQSNLL